MKLLSLRLGRDQRRELYILKSSLLSFFVAGSLAPVKGKTRLEQREFAVIIRDTGTLLPALVIILFAMSLRGMLVILVLFVFVFIVVIRVVAVVVADSAVLQQGVSYEESLASS